MLLGKQIYKMKYEDCSSDIICVEGNLLYPKLKEWVKKQVDSGKPTG